jgi:hypothetical protein
MALPTMGEGQLWPTNSSKLVLWWNAHFRWDGGLGKFGANWILELDQALDQASLHLGSPNHELSFMLFCFCWSEPIDFPSQKVPCRFCLDLPLFGLGPSSKGRGSNLGFLASRIALFHWTLDLGLSSKVTISLILGCNIFTILESKISSGFWLVLAGGGGGVKILILIYKKK